MGFEFTKFSRRVSVFGLLFLCVMLGGCHRRKRPVYAVIPKGTAVIHWQTVHAGAVAAAREANVDIDYNGPSMESDFARQISILDDLINLHVVGIIKQALVLVSTVLLDELIFLGDKFCPIDRHAYRR